MGGDIWAGLSQFSDDMRVPFLNLPDLYHSHVHLFMLPIKAHPQPPLPHPGGVVRLICEYWQTHQRHLAKKGCENIMFRQENLLSPCGKLTPSPRSCHSD